MFETINHMKGVIKLLELSALKYCNIHDYKKISFVEAGVV